jgi:O-antigen/teichoic acid export membrane protein
VFASIFNKTKGFLKQNDGLGHLQIFNLLKTAGIVVVAIVFAKFIAKPNLINSWETLLLLGSGFSFFYVSGLGYTLVSFVKRYPSNQTSVIFKNAFVLLLAGSLLTIAGIFISGHFFQSFQMPVSHRLLFSIYMLGTICSTLVEYIYFLHSAFKKLMVWGLVNFVLFVTCPTLPLLMGFEFEYALYAMAAFGLLKLIWTLALFENPFILTGLNYLKPLLSFNWPVIISLIFGTGYIYIANFILKAEVSQNDFNLFRYGSREFPLFLVLANSFSIVLGGQTASNYADTNFWSSNRKAHQRLMHQLFPIACVLMLCSASVFTIVFSKEFTKAFEVFNILLLTLIPRLLFPQSLLMGLGLNRFTFFSSLAEFIVGILLVMFLTPEFGIAGTAWGISIAYFIEKLILIGFCYHLKIPFLKSINLKLFMLYATILGVSFALSPWF